MRWRGGGEEQDEDSEHSGWRLLCWSPARCRRYLGRYWVGLSLRISVRAEAEALFEALVGGLVVGAAGEIVGEAGHVGNFFFEIVGVFVAFAVANIFHEAGDGVAEMERDGIGFGFVHVFEDFAVGGVNGIGFWRERKIDGGLREREIAFGGAEKIEGVFGGESDGERAGFGEADIFAGHAHQAAREIERFFAGFEHAGEPVESGVGIGIAHGFVERGDEIEVFFAGFVVAKQFALEDVFEEFAGDGDRGSRLRRRMRGFGGQALNGEVERVVGGAGVAIGEGGDAKENVVTGGDSWGTAALLRRGKRGYGGKPRSLSAMARLRSCTICGVVWASRT